MPEGLGAQITAGILGLLFVIGLVFLGRRIGQDLKKKFLTGNQNQEQQEKISPTLSENELVAISPKITPGTKGEITSTAVYTKKTDSKGGVNEIPRSGAGTILLAGLLIPAGIYLRKKS